MAKPEFDLMAWRTRIRSLIFHPDLGALLLIPPAWLFAWYLQLAMPVLEFQPSVYLLFLPAGVRTVAVLVYGFRGALITALSALITTSYLLDLRGGYLSPLLSTLIVAVFPPLFSWIAMVTVCRAANIPKTLRGLTVLHVAMIVLTQGFVVSTVKQFIYHDVNLADMYGNMSTGESLERWSVMTIGDVLGSLMGIFALILTFKLRLETQNEVRND